MGAILLIVSAHLKISTDNQQSQKNLHHSTMEPQMALFFTPKLIEKQVISKSKTNELFSAGQHTSPDSMHALRDNDEGLQNVTNRQIIITEISKDFTKSCAENSRKIFQKQLVHWRNYSMFSCQIKFDKGC